MTLFDVSHALSKLNKPNFSGIHVVDRLYLEYFLKNSNELKFSHYGLNSPFILSPDTLRFILNKYEISGEEKENNSAAINCASLINWLSDTSHSHPKNEQNPLLPKYKTALISALSRINIMGHIITGGRSALPQVDVYLNIAQYGLEYPLLFNWLKKHPSIKPIFFIHDLLPIDYREYFPPHTKKIFIRRFETIKNFAAGIITSSHQNKLRIEQEFSSYNKLMPKIFSLHLPSPLTGIEPDANLMVDLKDKNYFILIGTIEPRKNHLLIFDVWRQLIKTTKAPPKLICVGSSGWSNNATMRVFSSNGPLSRFITRVDRLPPKELGALISGAKALLAPSFAEGFGLPLIEAKTFGTPVICSDIPVFREIMGTKANFISPNDGIGWLNTIQDYSENQKSHNNINNSLDANLISKVEYFNKIEEFISSV
jgi:glycosyltransferase involved in cell wall biosynthesis